MEEDCLEFDFDETDNDMEKFYQMVEDELMDDEIVLERNEENARNN